LIACRCGSVNFGGRPPPFLGTNDSKPSALKLCNTSRTRSALLKVTFAI